MLVYIKSASRMSLYTWQVYCVTDAQIETVVQSTQPNECPVNPIHAIGSVHVKHITDNSPNLVTLNDLIVGSTIISGGGSQSYTLPPTDGINGNVLQTNGSGILTWVPNDSYSITSIDHTDSPYNVLESDLTISVDTTTSAVTLALPQISTLATTKIFTIVDTAGNAGTNYITIAAGIGDTIIGNTSIAINADYNSVTLSSDTVSKWFLT